MDSYGRRRDRNGRRDEPVDRVAKHHSPALHRDDTEGHDVVVAVVESGRFEIE
jgi:hypothetical protein